MTEKKMAEKCLDCDRDAIIKTDHTTYCAECYMRREVKNAKPYTPRSRTFTSSKAGGRTMSGRLPAYQNRTS
jgi:hypothetical protein